MFGFNLIKILRHVLTTLRWPRHKPIYIACVFVSLILIVVGLLYVTYICILIIIDHENDNVNFKISDVKHIYWISEFPLTNRTNDSRSPGSKKIVDHWQPVAETRDVFVFSAFLEENFNDRVRAVGAALRKSPAIQDLYCIMWHDDREGRFQTLTRASVKKVSHFYRKPYTTVFFDCPLGGNPVPAYVSLADKPHLNRPLNVLSIHIQTHTSPRYKLTSCVSPLFVSNDVTDHSLVEWIETNMILGVEFFTIYVYSISESELKILKYYEAVKKVELVNWTLAEDTINHNDRPALQDVHYFGQVIALNDCLYRNKGRSEFTMATDLDELIIPNVQQSFSLTDLLNRIYQPNIGYYSFRHTYHPTDVIHTPHPKLKDYDFSVKMVDMFRRNVKINRSRYGFDLSKVIFKPSATIIMDIHTVNRIVQNSTIYYVDPTIALLHHYRSNRGTPYVIEDRSTKRYLDKVLVKMNITWTAIKKRYSH